MFELNFCANPNVPFLLSALGHAATKRTAFRNLVMKNLSEAGTKNGYGFWRTVLTMLGEMERFGLSYS